MTDSAPLLFLRPAKVLWLVLIGIIVYLITVATLVPAGWLWHQASSRINLPPQVKVLQVSGRVWQGAAGVSVQNHLLRVSWQLGWPSLSSLTLPLSFTLESVQSELTGRLHLVWPDRAEVRATGVVHVEEFKDLIRRSGGAMLAGDITIDQLDLRWANDMFQHADGHALWPGGDVTWPQGERFQSAQFPAMQAMLSGANQQLSLNIAQQNQSEPVVDADIFPDGMLEIRVYKRLLDLAGQSWSGAAKPGDVIFQIRQPLLPGGR